MSIVTEVLASIRHVDGSVNELQELVKKADEVKVNVCQILSSRYSFLSATLLDTSLLQQKVSSTHEELISHQKNIQNEISGNIESSIGEVGNLIKQWQEAVIGLEAATTLLNIHTLLDEADKARVENDFLTTAENLAKVEEKVREASNNEVESQLEVISVLSEELIVKKTQLVYTIGEVLSETLSWEEDKLSDGQKSVTLLIKAKNSDDEGLQKVKQMLPALYVCGELNKQITTLANNLMAHFIKPVVINGGKVTVLNRQDAHALQVIDSDEVGDYKSSVHDVLHYLGMIFGFLNNCLLGVTVEHHGNNTKLMKFLGKQMGEQFTETLIKECLSKAVPCTRKDLTSFDDVRIATQDLHTLLVSVGFYEAEDKSILSYAANVDVVFSNKACAHILENAHKLMHQPLHHTVVITPLTSSENIIIMDEAGNKLEKNSMRLENLLSAKTFCLPKCKISGSVCELIELIYETMDEACVSSPQYAGRLFYTVRNILTIYCHVIPVAHKQALATLPQQAALVHNNCMYLAHHALLLGHQYKSRLPPGLNDNTITAVDLAQNLRSTSASIFLKALQTHRAQLKETLKDTTCVTSLDCHSGSVSQAEQGIRQCLHQLQLLHNVWQHVLPHTVYTKSIGTLVNSVIEELLTRVVALEDISTDAAIAFISILTLIKDNAPSLFKIEGETKTNSGDIIRNVRQWGKFCELILVLKANLKDILDRWSDGKGPLAHEFTADEIKQLIRALFQNTQIRAEVLLKIK